MDFKMPKTIAGRKPLHSQNCYYFKLKLIKKCVKNV